MRAATSTQRIIQALAALLLLAPMLAAFCGGTGAGDPAARFSTLAAACVRSLSVALLGASIALLIGVPAAWALSARRGATWRTALLILPLALPAPVAISGWVQLLAPDAASSFALPIAGFTSAFRTLLFSPVGAALVLGFALWPIVALHAWPAFVRTRNEAFAAASLSASPARVFFRVVLPDCRRHIAAGAALVFILCASDFPAASLLLIKTLAVEAHDQVALGRNAAAAWISFPLIVCAALLAFFIAHSGKRDACSGHSRAEVHRKTKCGCFSKAIFYAGVALGFLLPMLLCLRGVLNSGRLPSLAFQAGAGALVLSLRLAAAAALFTGLLALARLLAWPAERTSALNLSALVLLVIPGAVLAAGMLNIQIRGVYFLTAPPFTPSWLALAFALRFCYVPLRFVEEGLRGLDPELLDNAALLGQTRLASAFSIALPLTSGHFAAAAALVFVLALGEVPLAAVLAPPGFAPATIWLFNQQHMGYDEGVFALSLLLGLAAGAAVFIGSFAIRWVSRRKS